MNPSNLPTGRTGKVLALLLLLLVLVLAWNAVGVPLLDWHADRDARLQSRDALSARMDQLAAALPELRRQAGTAGVPATVPVLDGVSDAVAGAALQQKVQDMAAAVGATLSSAELLAAEPAGSYRRVRLRITLRAPWPVLVTLLQRIGATEFGMTVDDLQVHGTGGFIRAADTPLDASWTVLAFRPGTAA